MKNNVLIDNFLRYFENEKGKSLHTVNAYSNDINNFSLFIEKEFEIVDFKEVSNSIFRSWVFYLSDVEKISHRSINRKISSVRSFYKYLQTKYGCQNNPAKKQNLLKYSKSISVPLSIKEVKKLVLDIEYGDDFGGLRDKLMVELFYNMGVRKSELINIKEYDVDVYKKGIKILGKGNKERLVPISDNLLSIIRDYLQRKRYLNMKVGYLLVGDNDKNLTNYYVDKKIKSYLYSVTTKRKKSPHILRHTFASHMLESGADINTIKELMGHASLSSTQVYVKSSLKKIKEDFRNSHPRSLIKK